MFDRPLEIMCNIPRGCLIQVNDEISAENERLGLNCARLKKNVIYNPKLFTGEEFEKGDKRIIYEGEDFDGEEWPVPYVVSVTEEKLLRYKFVGEGSTGFTAHKSIVELLKKLCPDDFDVIRIIITEEKRKKSPIPPFVNRDYYEIRIKTQVDGIDRERSIMDDDPMPGSYIVKIPVFQDPMPWNGHLMARNISEGLFRATIYHPKLADALWEFRKQIEFRNVLAYGDPTPRSCYLPQRPVNKIK